MTQLKDKTCAACKGGIAPMRADAMKPLLQELHPAWKVVNEHHLERSYSFANFRKGLAFVNEIGKIAEEQAHHPDIYLSYAEVKVSIYTHKIQGLTESDFVLAAKIDELQG